jgi:hypothetical protein
MVPLKPQDVVVLLKLASREDATWSYPKLAVELGMSPSEVHASVRRATQSAGAPWMTRSAAKSGFVHSGAPCCTVLPRLRKPQGIGLGGAGLPARGRGRARLRLGELRGGPETQPLVGALDELLQRGTVGHPVE